MQTTQGTMLRAEPQQLVAAPRREGFPGLAVAPVPVPLRRRQAPSDAGML